MSTGHSRQTEFNSGVLAPSAKRAKTSETVDATNHIQEFWAKPEFLVTLASRLEDLEHNVATISGECSELKKDLALANLKNERLSAEVATLRQVVLRRRAQIPAHQGDNMGAFAALPFELIQDVVDLLHFPERMAFRAVCATFMYTVNVSIIAIPFQVRRNETVKALTSFPNLAQLILGGEVNTASMKYVGRLTSLQRLTFASVDHISDDGLSHLPTLTKLQSMRIEFSQQITPLGLIRLSLVPHLRSLTLFNMMNLSFPPTVSGFCTSLEELRVEDCLSFRPIFPLLAQLTTLRHLTIDSVSVADLPSMVLLGTLTNLETLSVTPWLMAHGDEQIDLSFLRHLTRLRQLYVPQHNRVSWPVVASLTQLTSLSMGNYFRPVDLDAITSLTGIRNLAIRYADSFESGTLAGLDFMRASLERLDLQGCPGLDEECIPLLSAFTSLRMLNLKETEVTEDALQLLIDALPVGATVLLGDDFQ